MSCFISLKWDSGDFHESKWNSSSGLSILYYLGEAGDAGDFTPVFLFATWDLFNILYLLLASFALIGVLDLLLLSDPDDFSFYLKLLSYNFL